MEIKLLLSNYPLVVTVLILCGILVMSVVCNVAEYKDKLITVMNPAVTEKSAEQVPLAPRLEKPEGKTIYLVDVNYEGMEGTPVMAKMQAWFTKNMPDVKTVLKLKSGNYVADDPVLWKEIADKGCDGVILGIAG